MNQLVHYPASPLDDDDWFEAALEGQKLPWFMRDENDFQDDGGCDDGA